MARPRRIDGISYVGLNRYFLTFCVLERARLFEQEAIVNSALLHFRKTAALERFSIIAYCFMPDHVHLLIEAQDDHSDLKRFAKLANNGQALRMRWQVMEGCGKRATTNES